MTRRDNKNPDAQKRDDAKAEDRMEAIAGIKRGLESMKRNEGKPAEDFQEFFAEKGISERERS